MKPINRNYPKQLIIGVITALILLSGTAMAENFKVDTSHTYILFRIKHLDTGFSYGRFNGVVGTFVFDEQAPENNRFEVSVPAVKVDTDNEKRDNHLRSEDFFNVVKYSRISFKSSGVKKIADNQYEISGELTLLGKSLPLTVTAYQTGNGKDPWGNFRRGFESKFTIQRSKWGLDFMRNGLSDDVDLTVSIEGIREK